MDVKVPTFLSTMNWKISIAVAVVSFFGVGSLVYLLLRKDEKNENASLRKTSKVAIVEVKIPKQCVGSVIGKGGSTIKEIEIKSNTRIRIVDDSISADSKICVIRGTSECVQYAECLIYEIIVSEPQIKSFEMSVPSFACGRIIGKHGDNIRMIHRSTKAKLSLESAIMSSEVLERKLVIKGTPEQIFRAKILVEQNLQEEKIFRSKLENLVPNGCYCKRSTTSLLSANGVQKETVHYRRKDKAIGNGENNLMEVYLSAIESPDRFWLQKVSCWSDLNKLVDEMSDYYSKEEHKQLHKLENLKLGQIVAVSVSDRGKWFRAEILDIQNNSNSEEPEILLYHVDFGDTEECKKGNVYELKIDFLKLSFQAMECMLAKVKPRHSTWSKEAIHHLKGLKHFGSRHSIAARILKYKERSTGTGKEKSLIPCVEVFDSHECKIINLAEVLVEEGFAVWEDEEEEEKEEELKSSGAENLVSDLELKETIIETTEET